MNCWPVPKSHSRYLPCDGESGSFWEQRQDRFHCGVDIYAPQKSDIISIADGTVVDLGIFTSPSQVRYWNTTYYLVIANNGGTFFRYAELDDVAVEKGTAIQAGDFLGSVGQVLHIKKIDDTCPLYIRQLKEKKHTSMLHIEWHDRPLFPSKTYLGGNWFGTRKPEGLLDPTSLLESISD
ncbi:MAG: M23 family metallopeptidase [Candidatus Thermoplasmatota archaeon]|nr:M23 family metallopeptidase [Candidatus Thermoplasmatota archaeon]